jgi:hypothetical protein
MTSPGQLGQASEESNELPEQAHESPRDTGRRPTGRFPLPRHKRAWLAITLSLIALAGVSAALIAVAIGGGGHQATSGGTSAATGGTSATPGSSKASPVGQAPNSSGGSGGSSSSSKATGKFPSAAQVAESGGALSLPASMQSRAIAWQSGPGGTHLAAVTRLFGDALQARGARQYLVMRSACAQLVHSVSTAEAGPQIPVAAMQTVYGQALTELAKGAADCRAAIAVKPGDESPETKVNATTLRQSTSELAAGARDIFRSTALIEIASRQSHG